MKNFCDFQTFKIFCSIYWDNSKSDKTVCTTSLETLTAFYHIFKLLLLIDVLMESTMEKIVNIKIPTAQPFCGVFKANSINWNLS